MKAALLIIDVQNKYCQNMQHVKPYLDFGTTFINMTSDLFRKKELPVIIIQHKSERDGCVPGNRDFDVIDEIKIAETDIRVIKTRSSGFVGTDLEKILKDNEVDTLVLTGLAAEYCVLRTYMSAEERGYTPLYLQNGVIPMNPDFLNICHKFIETVPVSLLYKIL